MDSNGFLRTVEINVLSTHFLDAFVGVLQRSYFAENNVLPSRKFIWTKQTVCFQSVDSFKHWKFSFGKSVFIWANSENNTIIIQFSCYWQVERWLLVRKLHLLIRCVILDFILEAKICSETCAGFVQLFKFHNPLPIDSLFGIRHTAYSIYDD